MNNKIVYKKSDILSKIDRKSGMTVPNDYFTDFAERLAHSLPQKELHFDGVPRQTVWQKVRPYVYMAAMFAGIWCMLKMFTLMKPSSDNDEMTFKNNSILAQAIENEVFVEEYYFDDVNEYDLLQDLYEDGFDTEILDIPNDN